MFSGQWLLEDVFCDVICMIVREMMKVIVKQEFIVIIEIKKKIYLLIKIYFMNELINIFMKIFFMNKLIKNLRMI